MPELNRELLEDYSAREEEFRIKFVQRVIEGKFSENEIYPPRERFRKLNDPIAFQAPLQSIWPQISFYGSLIIPIFPRDEYQFYSMHGFEVSDIPRLVDFSKDTGKVQFILSASPTLYEGLDFLEPIFKILKPPQFFTLPYETIVGEELIKQYRIEFMNIANIKFVNWITNIYYYIGSNYEYVLKRIGDYEYDYVVLRCSGYDEVIELLTDAMVNDCRKANKLFTIFGGYLAVPKLCPFRAIRNYRMEYIGEVKQEFKTYNIKISDYTLPFEIGKFLFKKLTLFSDGLEACRDIIGTYKQVALYKLLNNLMIGVKNKKFDIVNNTTNELIITLDNIWEDAKKIGKKTKYIRGGIPISLAIVGAMAGGPIAGLGGLLAGLGFNVLEKLIEIKSDSLSERFAKLTSPNYLCGIFDFQKAYQLSREKYVVD